jgi:hypothetical protein
VILSLISRDRMKWSRAICNKWRHNFRDHFESLPHLGAMLKHNNYFVMRMDNEDVIWTTFHAPRIGNPRIATSSQSKWRCRHSCIWPSPARQPDKRLEIRTWSSLNTWIMRGSMATQKKMTRMKVFVHFQCFYSFDSHAWIDGYPEKNDQDEGICSFSVLLFFWQLVEFAMRRNHFETGELRWDKSCSHS